MIVGLTGGKNVGKDTVAAYLIKEHNFERRAFADPLKKSVAALLGIPFSDIDTMKNSPDSRVKLTISQGLATYVDMTFREFLQRYGTEAHRDVFGSDFWLDQTLPVQPFYGGRAIVVTDLRFSNEADRVRELGGVVCRVYRDLPDGLKDPHRSEVIDFDWDHTINNNGSLQDLYGEIEEVLSVMVDRVNA